MIEIQLRQLGLACAAELTKIQAENDALKLEVQKLRAEVEEWKDAANQHARNARRWMEKAPKRKPAGDE